MSLFSSIGNLIGGAIGAITAPISELFGIGQTNSMIESMNEANQQVMQMSNNSLTEMQKLLKETVTSANTYASALGQPGIPMPNQQVAPNQPGDYSSIYLAPDGHGVN